MRRVSILIVSAALLLLTACKEDKDNSPTGPNNTAVSFANDIQPMFDTNCVGCHSPGGPAPAQLLNLSAAVSYNNLVNKMSAQDSTVFLVFPGDDSKSLIIDKLKGRATVGPNAVMPPSGAVLSNDQIDIIEHWINDGADRN